MTTIPFLDLKPDESLNESLTLAFSKTLERSHFVLGQETRQFEQAFADYCGSKYSIGVGSGLDALVLILKALDIGPGDEVIVPSHTFIATWLSVSLVGATICPVEVDGYFNIDPDQVSKAVNSKTKAILGVHLYGQCFDYKKLHAIAKNNKIFLIEDAAQAHGAKIGDKKVGTMGIAAGFSFYPAKNLGALGDAGAITTSSTSLYEKLLKLRNYGSTVKYHHDIIGGNSRLDEMQAAFLSCKLNRLPDWNEHRRSISELYMSELHGIDGLHLPKMAFQRESHVWHLFVIRTTKRKELVKFLDDKGIETAIHYPVPPHRAKAYSDSSLADLNFPKTESLADEILSLPVGPSLSIKQATYVCSSINEFFAQ